MMGNDEPDAANGRVASDAPRMTKRGRLWRFGVWGAILVALVTMLVLISPLRDAAEGLFSPPTPTAISPRVATAITATAEARAWATLQRRSMHLPAVTPGMPCPVSSVSQVNYVDSIPAPVLGADPVYAAGGGPSAVIRFGDAHTFGTGQSSWGGQKVLWVIHSTYPGPVLIRGRRIDGPGDMRFNGGLDQQFYQGDLTTAPLLVSLRLGGGPDYDFGTSWAKWPSFTRIQTAGCYAYQVDGLTFSEAMVFQAVFAQSSVTVQTD